MTQLTFDGSFLNPGGGSYIKLSGFAFPIASLQIHSSKKNITVHHIRQMTNTVNTYMFCII